MNLALSAHPFLRASGALTLATVLLSCTGAPQSTSDHHHGQATPANIAFAIAEARHHTHRALDVTPLLARAFERNLDRGYRQAARDTAAEWAEQVGQPALEDALVDVVDAIGDPVGTRRAALACAAEFETARDLCMSLFYDALEADADILGLERTWITSANADRLEQIHGNSSVLFKVRVDGHTVAAFKPLQDAPLTNVRGEIAAYRLCALIGCALSIPQNREAWIDAETFMELANVSTIEGNAVDRLEELNWFDDGEGPVLYGTLKAWVPGFTNFPLEMTDVWRPLVDPEVSIAELEEMDLATLLRPFAGVEDISYSEIIARTGNMTAVDMARQLSDLHVFDLLTNNFDRYQLREYGRNVQWDHEQFVSLDNGASFQEPGELSAAVPARHLRLVGRFSRSLIFALRNLDEERARTFMFPPDEHFDDDGVFEFFLERRDLVLAHVDHMIELYGEDAVLSLP